MHLFSAVLLGIATNLDNLTIGVMLGLQNKKVSILTNLCISFISVLTGFLFCFLAFLFTDLGNWVSYLGGGVLIFIGIFTLLPKREKEKGIIDGIIENENSDKKHKSLSFKESIVVALILAINCAPTSFGAGMAGMNAIISALFIGVFSFVAIALGSYIGRASKTKINGKLLEWIAALLMIGIGIIEIIT